MSLVGLSAWISSDVTAHQRGRGALDDITVISLSLLLVISYIFNLLLVISQEFVVVSHCI